MVPHKDTDSTVYLTSLTGKMVCHAKASPDLTANVQTISEDLLQNVWISLDLTSVFIFVSHHRGCMTLFQGNVTVYLFYPLFIHIFACFLTGSLHVFYCLTEHVEFIVHVPFYYIFPSVLHIYHIILCVPCRA